MPCAVDARLCQTRSGTAHQKACHCLATVGAGDLESRGIMIDKREILEAASSFSLLPNVVEKDYVLGWILAGINAHEELAENWVFKGGTCLKKCYFETYRFSEDLDFTVTGESHLDADFLDRALREVAAWVYENTGIEVPADQLRLDVYRNNRQGLSCEGRLYYNGPLRRVGSLPRI